MVSGEEEPYIAWEALEPDCRDEAGDRLLISRPTIAGVERDRLGFDPIAERVGDLSASENVTQGIVMVVAKDEQITAVPSTDRVDLIRVMRLDELVSVFLELGVATGRREPARLLLRKAPLAVPRVMVALQLFAVRELALRHASRRRGRPTLTANAARKP